MLDSSENSLEFQMSYLTWRLLLKPQIILFSLIPIIEGLFFSWYRLGYLSILKSFLYVGYFAILIIFSFSVHELILINRQIKILYINSAPSQKSDKNKSSSNQGSPPTDEMRKLSYIKAYLILVVMFCFFSGSILSYFFIFKSLLLIKALIVIAFILLPLLIYRFDRIQFINEIIVLIFWSFNGLFLSSYLVSEGSGTLETFQLSLPLLLSALLYIVVRYFILENRVYVDEEFSLEQESVVVSEKQDKKNKVDNIENIKNKYFKIEKNAFFVVIFIIFFLLYYILTKNLFTFGMVSFISLFSLFWSLNIVKQIITVDYENPIHLLYMYKSTKNIYYWLNCSLVVGLVIDYLMRYRFHMYL